MTFQKSRRLQQWPAPFVPEGCAACPIGPRTICNPLLPHRISDLEKFKTGVRVLPAKRVLYRQGEECSELYHLIDGWVALYVMLSSGERQIIDIALPGAFIGFQGDLSAPLRHSAEAITPVSVCAIPRRGFDSFLKQHPEVAIRLNRKMAQELDHSRDMLVNVGARVAYATLANLFVMLYRRSREMFPDRAGDNSAYVPLTQEQLAAATGVTSVHMSNLIKEFRTQSLVDFHKPTLTVRNYNGLLKAASYEMAP